MYVSPYLHRVRFVGNKLGKRSDKYHVFIIGSYQGTMELAPDNKGWIYKGETFSTWREIHSYLADQPVRF